jgi:hypothetical protein
VAADDPVTIATTTAVDLWLLFRSILARDETPPPHTDRLERELRRAIPRRVLRGRAA